MYHLQTNQRTLWLLIILSTIDGPLIISLIDYILWLRKVPFLSKLLDL